MTTKNTTVNKVQARQMLKAWKNGNSKSQVEREFLNDFSSSGKRFSSIMRNVLGTETETRHPLAVEVARLRRILDKKNISY